MSSDKEQFQLQKLGSNSLVKSQEKLGQPIQSLAQSQKNYSQSLLRIEQKNQNPKIGRPAKTDQEQEFKKYYLENKQKFQLQCQLLVYVHQNYFDQIIDNPINARVSKELMDKLFLANGCQKIYRTLLKLNENYFKNSSYYPQQKLKYTSLIDVAYMVNVIKEEHGNRMSSVQLLLVIFFYLYNEKLINQNFYDYFVKNIQKFREGMIFGPGGKNGPKLQKLDKLIICLALELADLEKILIQEQVIYTQDEYQSSQEQEHEERQIKKVYHSRRIEQEAEQLQGSKPKKKIHE